MSPLSRGSLLPAAGAAVGPALGGACAGREAAQTDGAPTPTGQAVKLRYVGRGTIANQDLQKAGLAEFQKCQPKITVEMEAPAYNKELFDRAQLKYPDDTWTWDTYATNAARLTVDQGGRRSGESGFDPALIPQLNEVLAQTQS